MRGSLTSGISRGLLLGYSGPPASFGNERDAGLVGDLVALGAVALSVRSNLVIECVRATFGDGVDVVYLEGIGVMVMGVVVDGLMAPVAWRLVLGDDPAVFVAGLRVAGGHRGTASWVHWSRVPCRQALRGLVRARLLWRFVITDVMSVWSTRDGSV